MILKKLKTLDIQENTSDSDCGVLMGLASAISTKKPTFVEIGTWKGKSAAVLAHIASAKQGVVYTVDHFMGNPGTKRDEVAERIDLFAIFRHNMRQLGYWQTVVKPLVMDSESASRLFKNKSVDLVFIDAGHWYSDVIHDVSLWLPKIKKGGVICGHDCQEYYLDIKEEADEMYTQVDCAVSKQLNRQIHFGVVKAVYDMFGDDYKIFKPTSVWGARVT